MSKGQFADVILPLAIPRLYTYSVPAELTPGPQPGTRVVVQFGKKKLYAAIVFQTHTQKPERYQTKDILQVIDSRPIVTDIQLKFWEWIASYYMCSLGEVMKAGLPSGLKMESETCITRTVVEDLELTSNEEMVLNQFSNRTTLSIQQLVAKVDLPNTLGLLKSLLEKQAIAIHENIESIYKPKTETYLRLNPGFIADENINTLLDSLKRAPAQEKLLIAFLSMLGANEPLAELNVLRKRVIEKSQVSAQVVKTMVDKGIFLEEMEVVSRLHGDEAALKGLMPLSIVQAEALRDANKQFEEKSVVLLNGVTSSGKTELYLHLISEQIEKGRQVLYLLPEIALTTQIINRLKRVFGKRVGVYHSKFSDSERVEVYQGVLSNHSETNLARFDIVLGVRSSVFLPFTRLGLVIIDEEHENTYKQFNPSPRYNARDSAIMLASLHGARVLLGTATPSIESYYNARTGKYGLVDLTERYKGVELPEVRIINTTDARKRRKMKSHFSEVLLDEIGLALANKEQVILFQNRRGFAPFIECDECAWVPKCDYCDVSLTLHKSNHQLVCHYCGFAIQSPPSCLACGSANLQTRGFGTEKVEEELNVFFPNAIIERLDLDSTRSKRAYERIINDFETGKTNILIGTQMVTKGLDFDRVSLVGILNADTMLNFPDFRAYERSYQLMSQVSGRAGRRNRRGLVLIQTAQPKHPIIDMVVKSDFMGLYSFQIIERKEFKYPPFFRLISITLKHKNQTTAKNAATQLADSLKEKLGRNVLGPESPPINRIQGLFLYNILVKVEREKPIPRVKSLVEYYLGHLRSQSAFRTVIFSVDVDPM